VACDFFVVITATFRTIREIAAENPLGRRTHRQRAAAEADHSGLPTHRRQVPEHMSDQVPSNEHQHSLPVGYQVVKRSVRGGLHHKYGLVKEAA
jgi:hypothetical protein